ncbi:MAG: RNA-binding S4 domain-containing protein [Nannocystis sp.]|jgi:ribosome-associated heat shock protein Hsp15|nr:RNA-binding S4 domain-containing protein [Nannocystis sp.]
MSGEAQAPEGVRLDKWLWAARCYKTRSIASDACTAGHVKVNGAAAKPSKTIRAGDEVVVRIEQHSRILVVLGLSERRGPAETARLLYEDRSPAPPPPEARPYLPVRERGAGRPSKRERRDIEALRGRG